MKRLWTGAQDELYADVRWRKVRTQAEHARDLPVRETAMVQLGLGHAMMATQRAIGRDCVIGRLKATPLMSGYLVPSPGWVAIMAAISWRGDYVFNGRAITPGDVQLVSSGNGYSAIGQNRDILGVGMRASVLKRTIAIRCYRTGA